MLTVEVALFAALAFATIWPDLPFGRAVARLVIKAIAALSSAGIQAKALLAISASLLLFAAFWALTGDAPMFLALILPELAAWFATFEIATLAEVLVSAGTVVAAARAAGVRNYFKGRIRARRSRRARAATRAPANEDEPVARLLAA